MKRKQDRDKFEEVGEECMLVGYAENSKAWRVIVCRDGKIQYVESPNVRFDEGSSSSLRLHFHEDCDASHALDGFDIIEPGQMGSDMDELEEANMESGDSEDELEELEDAASSDLDDLGNDHDEEEDIDVFSNPAFDAGEEPEEDSLPGRYPTRHRVKPSRFGFDAYINSTVSHPEDNPTTYKQAMSRQDATQWEQAINEELVSLKEMGVYEESELGLQINI
jgi:hypothetical protein